MAFPTDFWNKEIEKQIFKDFKKRIFFLIYFSPRLVLSHMSLESK